MVEELDFSLLEHWKIKILISGLFFMAHRSTSLNWSFVIKKKLYKFDNGIK